MFWVDSFQIVSPLEQKIGINYYYRYSAPDWDASHRRRQTIRRYEKQDLSPLTTFIGSIWQKMAINDPSLKPFADGLRLSDPSFRSGGVLAAPVT
jgi:hypothetical protein